MFINYRCFKIFKHRHFDNFILTIIVLQSFKLVADTYYNEKIIPTDSILMVDFKETMKIFDYAFNGIFAVELIIKSITKGFIWDY